MKKSTVFFALTVSAALVMMTSGCKHREVGSTHIPGQPPYPIAVANPNPNPGIGENGDKIVSNEETTKPVVTDTGIPIVDDAKWKSAFENGTARPEILAQDTVYFETDAAAIKPSEQSKLDDIIKYFKDNKTDVLMIEGHCDERGTEGYNMSLGDKRALAVREYLATGGVEAGRIRTVSYGESKPIDPGHNEAAWQKNRRGAPVVMQPKQ